MLASLARLAELTTAAQKASTVGLARLRDGRAAVEGAEAGDRAHVAAAGGVDHVGEPHVVEHTPPQRRQLLDGHGDLLSLGLPKPGDPGRRRRSVYVFMYSPNVGKSWKSNFARYLNM